MKLCHYQSTWITFYLEHHFLLYFLLKQHGLNHKSSRCSIFIFSYLVQSTILSHMPMMSAFLHWVCLESIFYVVVFSKLPSFSIFFLPWIYILHIQATARHHARYIILEIVLIFYASFLFYPLYDIVKNFSCNWV